MTINIPASYIKIDCRECLASVTHLAVPASPKRCCSNILCMTSTDHCDIFFQFCYVYFSCSKIELFRSKLGIAFSSVFTVLSSILMSLGLSGLSLDMNSKMCVVPYLVAFISLENILVITRFISILLKQCFNVNVRSCIYDVRKFFLVFDALTVL